MGVRNKFRTHVSRFEIVRSEGMDEEGSEEEVRMALLWEDRLTLVDAFEDVFRIGGDEEDSAALVGSEGGVEVIFGLRLNANFDFGAENALSSSKALSSTFNCYTTFGHH